MPIDCSKLSGRRREICTGLDAAGFPIEVADIKRVAYLRMWYPEATTEEIADVVFRRGEEEEGLQSRGLGDTLTKGIKKLTRGLVKPCTGCKNRAAAFNHLFPAKDLPPVEKIELDEPVQRNFNMHLWPVKGNGAWRWNCDQIMKRADLFNGRRVVAIVTGPNTDHPDEVIEYLKNFTDEFIVLPNNTKIGEVATWIPRLERMESFDPNTVTFCCHGKCARHNFGIEAAGHTIYDWTRTMYEECLDNWPKVRKQLQTKAMTGCFKRYGQFATKGNHRWHYSGTFYWFRNRDVFKRNWRHVDRQYYGTESWPGHMFKPEETGCLLLDGAQDLYLKHYWDSVVIPAIEKNKRRRNEN